MSSPSRLRLRGSAAADEPQSSLGATPDVCKVDGNSKYSFVKLSAYPITVLQEVRAQTLDALGQIEPENEHVRAELVEIWHAVDTHIISCSIISALSLVTFAAVLNVCMPESRCMMRVKCPHAGTFPRLAHATSTANYGQLAVVYTST